MLKQNKIYPSIIQTVYLLVSFFILTLLIEIVNRVFLSGTVNTSLLNLCRTLVATSIILLLAYLLKKRNDKCFTISFKPINKKIYFWVTLISPLYFFFIFGIVAFICALFTNFVTDTSSESSVVDIYTFISIVCLAPIGEELLFRGIILDGFLHRYSPFKAIFFSTLFFSALHFGPQIASAIFLGLITGYLFYYTKSVWPGIVLHGLNNLFAFFVTYLNRDVVSKESGTLQSFNELISTIGIWWGINALVLSFILYRFFVMLKSKYYMI